jgi:hypothetical protein
MLMPMPAEMFQSVTLLRSAAGAYSGGRWVNGAQSSVVITACVQPASMKELMSLEEGDRTKESIGIWSTSEIRTANEATGLKADRVSFNGLYWQVRNVENYGITPDLHHYHAVAVREQSK